MYDASKDEKEDGDDDALKIAIDENATSTFSERHFNNSFSRTFILNVRWSVALSYKKNNYEFCHPTPCGNNEMMMEFAIPPLRKLWMRSWNLLPQF